jgi:hypothetical protein
LSRSPTSTENPGIGKIGSNLDLKLQYLAAMLEKCLTAFQTPPDPRILRRVAIKLHAVSASSSILAVTLQGPGFHGLDLRKTLGHHDFQTTLSVRNEARLGILIPKIDDTQVVND